MLVGTISMAAVALALVCMGYAKGHGQHIAGSKAAFQMTVQILPLLLFSFLIAGMLEALLAPEFVSKWLGPGSGMRGVLIGTVTGGLAPGGPFVSLPIAGGLLRAGAGVGTMVAFMTGWSLWAVARLPMEVGVLGWRLTAIRLVCTFFFPPIAGAMAAAFFGKAQIG